MVQWEGLPKEEATWEDQFVFVKAFSTFNLEGKVDLNGGGIVMKPMKKGENTTGETVSQGHVASGGRGLEREQGHKIKNTEQKVNKICVGEILVYSYK